MIPTKNRLAIKQYIRDKPVRWGIKSFLLCEAKTGYILDAEIYTGRVRDRHWPLLGSAGSVVRRLVENSQVTNKNHMLFMDRFYNAGPGTGKSGGEPQRSQPRHAPALEPPQAARLPPRLSQGPVVSSPPTESHSVSFAGPALGKAPARGPWGFRHHGTWRRQTPTSVQARRRAGNREERGRTPALATPPRSRSRSPTSRTASSPPQSGARGLVAPQNIPQRKLCGPSPRQGARPRPVGVPSSRNLEAPDAHQRASTPQGRERGRAGANPSQTPTSAQARRRAGNGEERGRTPALATPPRSRSRAPSKPRGVRPPQSGAHGLL